MDATLHQQVVVASVSRALADGWRVGVAAGALVAGELFTEGEPAELRPGWIVGVDVAKLWVAETDGAPFLSTSLRFAASSAPTRLAGGADVPLTAVDLRAAVTIGKTVAEVWTPTLSLRAFGGPVMWRRGGEDRVGSDRYHVQVAIGSTFRLPGGLAAYVDWSPVTERALSAGLSLSL